MKEIVVEHLYKAYNGVMVLRDACFRADASRIACVTAPSGGGKTTLFRILLGLERPDSGTIRLPDGCRWSAAFQEDRLLPGRDAHANLRFALGKAYNEREAASLLDALGLGDVDGKPSREYSGGMRRRLALARALLSPSDALALDEPFTGLDAAVKLRCLDAARRYAAGRVTLLSTHTLDDADALDAQIVRLS